MTTRVLFDVSRLMSRIDRGSPTGVDRVCLAYAEWLSNRPGVQMIPVRGRKDRLVAVDPAWFERKMRTLRARWSGGEADRPETERQRRLFAALLSPTRPAASVIDEPPPPESATPRKAAPWRVWRQYFRSEPTRAPSPVGDLYVSVGHTGLHTPAILQDLEARGIDRVVLIHDLIPVTHPEFCRPGDGDKHRARVRNVLRHASRVIVNSAYTGDELQAFARTEGLLCPPVHVAHLGLEPDFLQAREPRPAVPFFVHIGTIEARKNLAFLLTLWRRLEERNGDACPRLVLVGRYGWENEAVLDHLQRSPNLQGLVHQAENLPDAALATLMRDARAVLAPSSVEGFDLPAVEASAMRCPLIASDIPAHRELIGHARLVDPLDGPGWIEAIEALAGAPAGSGPAYDAPTWKSHFAVVEQALDLPPVGVA